MAVRAVSLAVRECHQPRFLAAVAWAAVMAVALLFGCREERVEYHKRPGFYSKLSSEHLPEEVTLEDGTVIRYHTNDTQSIRGLPESQGGKLFQMREENEDGTITLRAMLPEHVLANALACVRNEEYELMYEQMLSDRTRRSYEEAGQGLSEFTQFFRKNRHELAATLTRMVAGLPAQDVSFTNLPDNITRCRLRPQIAEPGEFKFSIVDVVNEGEGLKLLMIR